MLLLSSTPHNNIRYMLKVNYEQLYTRISQVLAKEDLSLFAEPKFTSSESYWYSVAGKQAKTLSSCNEDEKDLVADLLRDKKERVEKVLSQFNEFKSFTPIIFSVPDENNIHLVSLENGEYDVVLSLWACLKSQDYTGSSTVGTFLERPKSNHTAVKILIKYTDGTISNDRDYFFKYKNRMPRKFIPNEAGEFSFGQLKNESSFVVSTDEGNAGIDQTFTVEEGKELYVALFPYFTTAVIRVKNQLGELVKGCELIVKASNKTQRCITGEEGEVLVDNILLDGKPLKVSVEGSETLEFSLGKEGNEFVYTISERILRQPIINIVDTEGNSVANYPLLVRYNDIEKQIESNEDGIAALEELDLDQELEVVDGMNNYNNQKFIIQTEGNEFVFKVDPPKERNITLRFLDHKKKPLVGNALDIKIGDEVYQRQSNEKGEAYFSNALFENNKPFEVGVHFTDKKGREKVKQKKILYQDGKDEYIIYFKRFNWWWLLLLLIPLLLLLFLNLEKEAIVYTVTEEGQFIDNSIVTLEYEESFLYGDGHFFQNNKIVKKDTTNIRGEVSFNKLRYSIYSLIFKNYKKAVIGAESDCYISDTLSVNYHKLSLFKTDTITLSMKPKLDRIRYTVIDDETELPINGAFIKYERSLGNEVVLDSVKTNANGEVSLKNFPICGKINWLEAKAGGYEDYKTNNISYKEIQQDNNLSVCRLKPLKESIEFFVINCENKEPIPDAEATITITNRQDQTIYTNIDGRGRGYSGKLNVLSKVQIEADHKYFNPGKLDKIYTVEEFVKLPDSLRTICLEPKPNTMDFFVVDSLTRKPIAGSQNIVTLIKSSGQVVDTLLSNRNGSFTISDVKLGDKITIVSSKSPEYKVNDSKMVQIDAISLLEGSVEERTIPLSPKVIQIEFTTIDEVDQTILEDVGLDVFIDNALQNSPVNSGKGTFTVEGKYTSRITIIASKKGFAINDYSIRDLVVGYLSKQDKEKRQIPLSLTPCEDSGATQEVGDYSLMEYDLRKNEGIFHLKYSTDKVPDAIRVYCGRKKDFSRSNELFKFEGSTGTGNWEEVDIKHSCRYITIETENLIPGSISTFQYIISCPKNK